MSTTTTTTPTAEEAIVTTTTPTTTHGTKCEGCALALREAKRIHAAMPAAVGATVFHGGAEHEAHL